MSVTSPALTIQDLPTLSRLLDEAWELDVSARQHWLQTLPPEYARLKPKLQEMLSKSAGMETDVFVKGAHDAAETLIHERGSGASAAWQADADIGGYRLIRELGLGGMGAIWLAERSGGELKRQVALKLPLFSIHNKALAERFNRERDILASLTHPNIARLYDAGTTSTGQPYLALERVEGQAITQHCNALPSNAPPGLAKPLTIDARVHLFLQVLDAVQYAHSNLVLHRDLKPANVMVTADGQVKLLDFGIAKLISATDIPAEETALTQVGGHALTPDYASPEQIAGNSLTTASDVYSLGVLLYELLVGERPYKLKGQGRAALEQAILNTEPVKPSHRVRTTERINTSPSTRKKIANKLAGDLDTILLKALKKKPSDRYETAAAFAADLKRYLSGEAVDAQPDSNWYRLRKLIGRNKLAVGSAAAVMVALIAGTGAATWQAQQARKQAAKSAAVQTFLLDIFKANSDRQKDPEKARNTTARELIDIGADKVTKALVDAPEARIEVLNTIADMYQGFAQTDRILEIRREVISLTKTLYGSRSKETVEALLNLVGPLRAKSLAVEQHATLKEAEAILDELGDHKSLIRAGLLTNWASYYATHDRSKAVIYSQKSVELFRKHPESDALAEALQRYGAGLTAMGRMADALAPLEEAIAVGQKHNMGTASLSNLKAELGRAYAYNLKFGLAETVLRDAVLDSTQSNGDKSVYTSNAKGRLGLVLSEQSRLSESLAQQVSVITALEKANDGSYELLGPRELVAYGRTLLEFGDLDEANTAFKKAKELWERKLLNNIFSAVVMETVATCLAQMGRDAEADAALASANQTLLKLGKGSGSDEEMLHRFAEARTYLALGRTPQAVELLRGLVKNGPTLASAPFRAVTMRGIFAEALFASNLDQEALSTVAEIKTALANHHAQTAIPLLNAKMNLIEGGVKLRAGDAAGALPLLEKALAERVARLSPSSPFLAEAYLWVARAKLALGKRSEAASLLQKATEIRTRNKQLGEYFERQFRDVKVALK
jgi:eukaryotic-like serine/threonine-protein kinase